MGREGLLCTQACMGQGAKAAPPHPIPPSSFLLCPTPISHPTHPHPCPAPTLAPPAAILPRPALPAQNKPDAIRAKIAEGRVKKLGQEMALLDQPFLTDPTKTVAEAVKEATAAIGEKISVRRFVKFQLGEGLEKKSSDFAAEVAAATGQK